MEREFNIFGPIDPTIHYHVDRTAVKSALRQKIEKGRYVILDAAPQTGKTTIFQEIIAELEADSEYFGILLDFKPLVADTQEAFYQKLAAMLTEWSGMYAPVSPEPTPMRHHNDFARWLGQTSRRLDKKCLLIMDGFEEFSSEIAIPLLAQFRNLYHQRYELNDNSPHSILMVGVQTEHIYLGGLQSPFNIADRFTVPYFTEDEVEILLRQYIDATGQVFDEDVIQSIYEETEGQPFLVNRLIQILTTRDEADSDIRQSITWDDFKDALLRLVEEENPHFSIIHANAALYQSKVVDTLINSKRYYSFRDDVGQELLMCGVMRTVTDEQDMKYAQIANPIYQKVLFRSRLL